MSLSNSVYFKIITKRGATNPFGELSAILPGRTKLVCVMLFLYLGRRAELVFGDYMMMSGVDVISLSLWMESGALNQGALWTRAVQYDSRESREVSLN